MLYLLFGRCFTVPPTLQFHVFRAEFLNVFAVVESGSVAQIDPKPDLHFVTLHRVEDESWWKPTLQRNLTIVSVTRK